MFLKEFKNDEARQNFITLSYIVCENELVTKGYIQESGLKIKWEELQDECEDILSLKDDKEEFKEVVLDLLDGADFKFYIEFLMLTNLIPSEFTNEIKDSLEDELILSDKAVTLLNNWAINTAAHINNAVKIISSVR